jgi:hypothetical protein
MLSSVDSDEREDKNMDICTGESLVSDKERQKNADVY